MFSQGKNIFPQEKKKCKQLRKVIYFFNKNNKSVNNFVLHDTCNLADITSSESVFGVSRF